MIWLNYLSVDFVTVSHHYTTRIRQYIHLLAVESAFMKDIICGYGEWLIFGNQFIRLLEFSLAGVGTYASCCSPHCSVISRRETTETNISIVAFDTYLHAPKQSPEEHAQAKCFQNELQPYQ